MKKIATIVALLSPFAASAQSMVNCQLSGPQDYDSWKIDMKVDYTPPVWEGDLDARTLYDRQINFIVVKKGPFTPKISLPATLSDFESRVTLNFQGKISTTKTVDGVSCHEVKGGTLTIKAAPVIRIASQLQERNCVSRAALTHQKKNNEALIQAIKDLMKNEDKVKKAVYPIFSTLGATGENEKLALHSLKMMQNKAEDAVIELFEPHLKLVRYEQAENYESWEKLHEVCNGDFSKTAVSLVPGSRDVIGEKVERKSVLSK